MGFFTQQWIDDLGSLGQSLLGVHKKQEGKQDLVRVDHSISEGRIAQAQRNTSDPGGRGSEREDVSGGLRGLSTLSSGPGITNVFGLKLTRKVKAVSRTRL